MADALAHLINIPFLVELLICYYVISIRLITLIFVFILLGRGG